VQDYFAVINAPFELFCGIDAEPSAIVSLPDEQGPDVFMYDIKRYCELLLQGNPFV
jgi:hypothetical protein